MAGPRRNPPGELNKQPRATQALGTLLKEEAGTRKKEAGAPSLSAQEDGAQAGAPGMEGGRDRRAVKLSRGEVELILELSSR
jgi:hypothetical protein